MQVQNWTVYKNTDGKKERIGQVVTSLPGLKEVAFAKAAYKYNSGKPFTIGWKLEVKKGTVENK